MDKDSTPRKRTATRIFNCQLGLVKIPVSDVQLCAGFYRDVLGFTEEFVMAEYGWAQMQAGNLPIAVNKPGMDGGDANVGGSTGFHLSLELQTFTSLAQKLRALGALSEDYGGPSWR